MSALPLEADISPHSGRVGLVPLPDICITSLHKSGCAQNGGQQ
jgi:hypothetical protein